MEVLERVRRTIRRHGLAEARTRVIVAVSGGSDSVALAHLVHQLAEDGALQLTGISHFNHQLRPSSNDDEAFCRTLAATLGLPYYSERGEVLRPGRSIEDAAREARLAFFERARGHFGADVVATGHTQDDQAETLLLRMIRGAGLRGLGSMHPRRGHVIRPLLDCGRQELRDYLSVRLIPYVHDESNDDLTIPRNRVRAELIPFLKRFNPRVVEALAGEADILRETWVCLEGRGQEVSGISRQEGDLWRIDAEALAALPVALARHLVHEAMSNVARGRTVSLEHVDEAIELSRLEAGSFDAPGQHVERMGRDIVLRSTPADWSGRWPVNGCGENKFRYALSIPGEAAVAEAGCVISAEESRRIEGAILGTAGMATIRRAACRPPFSVRGRIAGDRFRPLGMDGVKKLQDFFVDRKVARPLRDIVPLVVDRDDRIVWVAGHVIDEEFRVTDPAEAVVILRLKVLGGPA